MRLGWEWGEVGCLIAKWSGVTLKWEPLSGKRPVSSSSPLFSLSPPRGGCARLWGHKEPNWKARALLTFGSPVPLGASSPLAPPTLPGHSPAAAADCGAPGACSP